MNARLLICILMLGACAHAAAVTVTDPGTWVVDQAGVVDAPSARRLESLLDLLHQRTSAEVKVLTVRSLEGEDVVAFAQRHAELWKTGAKGRDTGAIILLAVAERKVRIQVGYGLEGVLPDSWCGTLSRTAARDYFAASRHGEGLVWMTEAVAAEIAADAGVTLEGLPERQAVPQSDGPPLGVILMILAFVVMVWLSRRGGGRGRGGFFLPMLGGFGGGFGSHRGGFGGFGGGMGGGMGGGFGGGRGGGNFGGGGRFGGGGGGASW